MPTRAARRRHASASQPRRLAESRSRSLAQAGGSSSRRMFVYILSAALTMQMPSVVLAASDFPQIPANARTHTVVGVLVDYGIGADAGGFAVKTPSGKTFNFAVGTNMRINGVLVQCTAPEYNCPNWPRSIVLGLSRVKVIYWKTVDQNGNPIESSSQIDSVAR
jgi:hypothetical protein